MIEQKDVLGALEEIGVLSRETDEAEYEITILDSFAYIGTILALEEMFDVEFEDEYLVGSLFDSIDVLTDTINMLRDVQK